MASLLALGAVSLSVSACPTPDVAGSCPTPPGATSQEALAILSSCFGSPGPSSPSISGKPDVDILFVIDNSTLMAPKQRQLAATIDNFIKKLDASGANYHIGITSTDIGAQTAQGVAFQPGNLNIPGCDSFRGTDGALQRTACRNRSQGTWSAEAKAACASLCPTTLEPGTGDVYLWKQDGATNAPNNDILGTLKCAAVLGDTGCGLVSPLEAAKRALDSHSTANSGFLRQNSILAVIFLTDEDDCSVQMTARAQNNPNTIDCAKSGMSTYNCWKNNFRCTANNLTCKEPMTTVGAKTGCVENNNGYLESIDKYVRFFSNLRSSSKIVLAGIWAPTLLDNLSSETTKVGKLIVDGDPLLCVPGPGITCPSDALIHGQGTNAACKSTTDASFVGQAQLRLSKFIRSFDTTARVEQSICEPQNYGSALDEVAERIVSKIPAHCLGARVKTDASGKAACVVGLVDSVNPSAVPKVALAQCSTSCCNAWAVAGATTTDPLTLTARPVPNDPTISAACTSEPGDCYCAVSNAGSKYACKDVAGQDTSLAGLWIKMAPHVPPAGQVASFVCF
ncbi:MAG: hypothetical protein JNM40_24055 [Myxococcales bacterium]|nr:hypothetical protein [Myxococcales bacterium]